MAPLFALSLVIPPADHHHGDTIERLRVDVLGVLPMGSRSRHSVHSDGTDTDVRNQEVLRANRELAAYFRGKRTEREARAALKIIKAFIRDREKIEPPKRRPLPGAENIRHATVRKRSTASADKIEGGH